MSKSQVSRRDFLRWAAVVGAGSVVSACAQATEAPAPVEESEEEAPAEEEEVEEAAPAPEQITVTWENPDVLSWQPHYRAIADLIEEKNPGLTVSMGNVPEEGFVAKIASMIAGGIGPDVWTHYYAADMFRHGFIQEVSDFIEAEGIIMEELWFDICIMRGEYEGKHYATPRDGVWTAVLYNQDLFDEQGVSYPEENWELDDYLDKALAIRDEEKGYWGTMAGGPGSLSWDVGFCWNMGFEIVSEDGRQVKGLLDSEESIWAMQWMIDLQDLHDVSPSGGLTEPLGDYPFGSGNVGMADGHGWGFEDMKALELRFDQVQAPIKPGYEPLGWGDSVQHYMWSESPRKEAAWAVMREASGVEGNTLVMGAGGWTAPCPQTWLDLGADKDHITGPWWIEANRPTKIPNYLRTEYEWECVFPEFEGIWTRYMENGERPLEMLAQEAAENAQKCLDDRYAENP